MAEITLKGNKINTLGELPKIGDKAKDFTLTGTDLADKKLNDFSGKIVLNIFPSLDTPTCATSVRKFNEKAAGLENTTVLCISRDLPFAHGRFCTSEGIDKVVNLSDFRTCQFGKDYQLEIIDGPLSGLLSRVVIVLDENKNVVYTEQVPEIVDEPDYDSAIEAVKNI
ncbi:MAG TPA: thiol peroxidase [Bacteroidetes bacterium]|nr:thiol peroxidase [Bacteroidota bacterium]